MPTPSLTLFIEDYKLVCLWIQGYKSSSRLRVGVLLRGCDYEDDEDEDEF